MCSRTRDDSGLARRTGAAMTRWPAPFALRLPLRGPAAAADVAGMVFPQCMAIEVHALRTVAATDIQDAWRACFATNCRPHTEAL